MAEDDRDRERELADERGKEVEQELERVGQLDDEADEDDEPPEEKLQRNDDEDTTQVDPTGGRGGDSDS